MTDEIIEYLKHQRSNYSYEATAMSGSDFSRFLDGLLAIIDPPKSEPCMICNSIEHETIDHGDDV